MQKNQQWAWWQKAGVGSKQVYFSDYKDSTVSNMKINDWKPEWYSIHLRKARSLRQNISLSGKKLKRLNRFSEQTSEKYHSNTMNEPFLTS